MNVLPTLDPGIQRQIFPGLTSRLPERHLKNSHSLFDNTQFGDTKPQKNNDALVDWIRLVIVSWDLVDKVINVFYWVEEDSVRRHQMSNWVFTSNTVSSSFMSNINVTKNTLLTPSLTRWDKVRIVFTTDPLFWCNKTTNIIFSRSFQKLFL